MAQMKPGIRRIVKTSLTIGYLFAVIGSLFFVLQSSRDSSSFPLLLDRGEDER